MDPSIQYALFITLAPLAALISIGLLLYARLTHPSPETSALTGLMVTIAGWLIFNSLELINPTEAGTVFWAKVSYGFIAYTPVAWLAFALQYTGHTRWLAPSRFVLFCVIPLVTALMAWTTDVHHLLWTSYRFTPVDGMLALNVTHGPWFWVHAAHSYTLVFLGVFLIVRQYFRSFAVYRQQSIWLLIGALTPIAVNLVYLLRPIAWLTKDFTSVSFAFAGMAFAVGMLRYRLFDLKPVARDAVVDSMSDAMLAIDTRGRIVDLNPAAQAIIGRATGDIIGHPAGEVLSPWRDLVERYRDQVDVRTEITLSLNGALRYFDLRVSPLSDQQGWPRGRLVVLRDITERKQAEDALQRHAVELESRNEELDAFAHTVAHDLKNPLTMLLGYSDFVKNRYSTVPHEAVSHALNAIAYNARQMSTIIDALLLLARVRKLDEMSVIPLDMGALVSGVLDRLSFLIERCEAQVEAPDRWPAAMGYPPWIEQVWMNYIGNAINYGGLQPHIVLGADTPAAAASGEHARLCFWVQDHGPGIPAEMQDQLFTPFVRLGAERAEGHGLGLSIVQRIVRRLGGEVGVESRPGEGSRFWFTLPALPDEARG